MSKLLMEAVAYIDSLKVESLIKKGADPNYIDPDYDNIKDREAQPYTPLRLVIFRISDCLLQEKDLEKFAKIAALLVRAGADPKPAIELSESRYGKYDSNENSKKNNFEKVLDVIYRASK